MGAGQSKMEIHFVNSLENVKFEANQTGFVHQISQQIGF